MPRALHSPLRQAILDYIDQHGPQTTKELMAAGLEPRAAHGLYVENHLGVGARGYELASKVGGSSKPAPKKVMIPASCRVGYLAGKGKGLPPGIWAIVPLLPRRLEGEIKKVFSRRDPKELVDNLMDRAIAEERAKHFGTSKLLRRMCDVIDGGRLD